MNQEETVICFVNTTRKHTDRIENIQKTWFHKIDTVFYSDHEDLENNILKVSNRDDYASGEEKQINVLNRLKNLTDEDDNSLLDLYKWFFFVDDDTFVNVDNLREHLKFFNEDIVYGSIFDSVKDSENPVYKNGVIPKESTFPSGGAGFLVSSKVVRYIGEFKNYNTCCGDVSVGLNFFFNKVEQHNVEFFNSQNPEFYGHGEKEIEKSITYHYIKTLKEMVELFGEEIVDE